METTCLQLTLLFSSCYYIVVCLWDGLYDPNVTYTVLCSIEFVLHNTWVALGSSKRSIHSQVNVCWLFLVCGLCYVTCLCGLLHWILSNEHCGSIQDFKLYVFFYCMVNGSLVFAVCSLVCIVNGSLLSEHSKISMFH